MVKHLLFLSLFVFVVAGLQAQIIIPLCPADDAPAADACEDACLYCNLAGYTGSTDGYVANSAPGFCGTLENEQWLGFIAGASSITISATPSNCALGNGIQVALYQGCDATAPVGCDMGFAGGEFYSPTINVTLTPGEVYYLMVDGWAGDLCDFSLTVTPPGAAIGAQLETQNILFCPGESVVVNGMTFSEPGTYVEEIPSTSGGCDTIRTYIFDYLPQPTISQHYLLKPGESVLLGGNPYFAPDTVALVIPASVGCDTLATYFLLLDQSIPDTCSNPLSFIKVYGDDDANMRGEVLLPSSDGNFYIAGKREAQPLLMKVTPAGEVLWSRVIAIQNSSTANITDLVEDSEGMLVGCAITGENEDEFGTYAFRYNPANASFIWSRFLGLESPEAFAILEKNPGGNFLLLSSPQISVNIDDAEIWELNRNTGNPLNGLTNRYNFGISDVWTSMIIHDGALYTIGRHIPTFQTIPPIDKMRSGLSRINLTTGNPVWSRLNHLGPAASATLFGQDLIVHDDALLSVHNGNESSDPDAPPAFFLQKTTLDGSVLWLKRFNTLVPSGILASDIQQMSDGYAIVGWILQNGVWEKIIVKTDFNGDVLWSRQVSDTDLGANSNAFYLGQHQSAVVNDVLYVTATSRDFPTNAMLLKVTSEGEISDDCGLINPLDVQSQTVANPANISIQVPVTQFIAFSFNATTTGSNATIPVSTYCVDCVPVCDDTLDLGPDVILCGDSTVTFEAVGDFVSYLWQDSTTNPTFTTDEAGVYWVEVTDACGDKQRDSVLLTFSLVGDVKLKDTTLCQGGSLTISVPGFDTYDWSPSAGLDCDTCATVTIQPGVTTTYSLYAENAAGCFTSDTFTVTIAPIITLAETIEFCPGDVVTIGGEAYTESGTVIDTIAGTVGCDTIVTYTLVKLPYNVGAETIEFCPGDIVTIGGEDYTESGTVIDTIAGTVGCDTIVTYTLVKLPYNVGAETIEFCPGEVVTIGGEDYTESGTVIDTIAGAIGCDTIVTYTLVKLPYNVGAATIEFCPGEVVTIGGEAYTESGTVVDTIAGTVGCDTIVTYTLVKLPQPTRSETVEFCSGDVVNIGGNDYTQPGIVIDTIPATVGCDTVVTYILQFIDTPNSSVSIDCPDDIDVAIDPGAGPAAVSYNLPAVSSDCECPGIALNLTQGFASGSLFPVGTTTVCYQAKDSCGNTASCCFEVFVREEQACDVKTIGCMKWELLDITRSASSLNLNYRIRVTNTCANKMIYTAIQIPDGMVAVEPANNSVFTTNNGRDYDVRNPNYSPFYSIRFKSKADSIANGQSDIFEYTLPPQINPAYIHVNARLYPQIFYEAHLNTFNCPIQIVQDKPQNREDFSQSSNLRVFPNPTSGALYADLSDWQGEQLKVQILNSQGQQVQLLTMQAGDAPQSVELPEGLSAGLYFLEVFRENGEKQAVRFVVQR